MFRKIKTNKFIILKKKSKSILINYKDKKNFDYLINEVLIKKNSIAINDLYKINRIDDFNYLITDKRYLKQMLLSNLELIKII